MSLTNNCESLRSRRFIHLHERIAPLWGNPTLWRMPVRRKKARACVRGCPRNQPIPISRDPPPPDHGFSPYRAYASSPNSGRVRSKRVRSRSRSRVASRARVPSSAACRPIREKTRITCI